MGWANSGPWRCSSSGRQVNPEIRLLGEMDWVVRICRLVEGMPLAVELAASWMKYLSPKEIAEEVEASLDFLAARVSNVPEHHRQIRVVFEQSWERLDDAEQGVLARLSIFEGGFGRDSARAVAEASLPVLMSLVDKSLVRQTGGGATTYTNCCGSLGARSWPTLKWQPCASGTRGTS